MGHDRDGGTNTWEVVRALRQLGFVCSSSLQRMQSGDTWPERAVLFQKIKQPNAKPLEHWVLAWDGARYCPTEGKNPEPRRGEWFSGYIEILICPSRERVRRGVLSMTP